jgi:hypothetical protein
MPNASTRANPPSDVFIAVWEVKSNVPRMGAAGIPSVAVVVAVFAYAQAVGCETSRPLPCLSSSCRGRGRIAHMANPRAWLPYIPPLR